MPLRARTGRQRKADTIAKLEATGADAWVATVSPSGAAHLVPLSMRLLHVQGWRESNELVCRTLMRDGEWLV